MPGRTRYVLLIALLILAIVSFVFVRVKSGEGHLLLVQQHQAQALTREGVSRVVRVAPDPVTNRPGLSATCQSYGSGVLRNPWSCVIRYRSGRVIRYRITIKADGSYFGDHELVDYRGQHHPDTGAIQGCCISIP